jgi:hypothetical protein
LQKVSTATVTRHTIRSRHLTESQRASIAARLANMRQGRPQDKDANLHLYELPTPPPVTRAAAAAMLNVSERSVATARKVQAEAPAEIVQAVDDGRISVSLAAQVASLPEAAQAEIIAAPAEQVREVAREAVKKAHVTNNSGNNEWYTPRAFIDAARDVMGGNEDASNLQSICEPCHTLKTAKEGAEARGATFGGHDDRA